MNQHKLPHSLQTSSTTAIIQGMRISCYLRVNVDIETLGSSMVHMIEKVGENTLHFSVAIYLSTD